ncbi:MAG: hypothetical protein CMJ18_23035 [Phycisphaeraceae bacterium]|nr:hypothetical protein [Phycisphaeraceae bacterium]
MKVEWPTWPDRLPRFPLDAPVPRDDPPSLIHVAIATDTRSLISLSSHARPRLSVALLAPPTFALDLEPHFPW